MSAVFPAQGCVRRQTVPARRKVLVRSGRYPDVNEVMGEGMRMVEQRAKREAAQLQALREAGKIGFADLDEGWFLAFPLSTSLKTT